MTTLNIFIASSYELSEQRVLIGDYIRRLSYDYSPRGVRLRLSCWEDFYPEYTGISKQQEYDESLIKTCDIFIALFRTRCGIYARHEVEFALDLNKECHILQFPSTEEHHDLDKFLSSIDIKPLQCDDTIFLREIENIVGNYLSAHGISLSSIATPLKTWRLYATIPDDLDDLRIPFSNAVRGLENILEETLGCYFSLYPYHTPENISSTEHYICFIKDSWSKDDEREVETAYESCQNYRIPETALLYNVEGHNGERTNPLAIKINSEYEGFSKKYSNIDTIKHDLTRWALWHKIDIALRLEQIFSVEGDSIYCYGRPFFKLSMYPELQTSIVSIKASIAKIDEKIKRNIKDGRVKNDEIARDLAEKRQNKEHLLLSTIKNWYNKTQLLESLHTHSKKSPLETLKSEQFVRYTELSELIKSNTIKCKNSDKEFLRNFAKQLLEWEEVASLNLSTNMIQVSEYIQVLTHTVQIHDTYLHSTDISFDEDATYKKIIDASDKYDYHTLFTEVMRVNYANSLSRELQYDKAEYYYYNAYKNIVGIEDDSVMAHRYKSYVIKSLLCHYSETDNKDAVLELGKKYASFIHQWQKINTHTNYDIDLARCYSFVLAAAPKHYGVCKELAEESEILIKKLHREFDSKPFDNDYFDAICYFNIVLSAYFVDRYQKGDDEYFTKATHYIRESQKSLLACYPYDPSYISQSLPQPLHNRGFLYSKVGDWKSAISNYKSALKKREALYNTDLSDGSLFEIAETLVNLGDAYYATKKIDKAMECADRAISIYSSKHNKGIPVLDMKYYKAYQLKATILIDWEEKKGNYPDEALKMMQECLKWSEDHPGNDYEECFKSFSGRILSKYKKENDNYTLN